MRTLISFFNGQTESSTINGFENLALSASAMNKVRGGEGTPDIWIPDEDDNNNV